MSDNACISAAFVSPDASSPVNPSAASAAVTAPAAKPSGGYVPLGSDGINNIVWSETRHIVLNMPSEKFSNPGTLVAACGKDWVMAHYSRTGRNGEFVIDGQAACNDITEACTRAGQFDDDRILGSGVHRAIDDPNVLVINSGRDIWRTDGALQKRAAEAIYVAYDSLNIDRAQAPATSEDAADVLETLHSWRFHHKGDPLLMLGWIGSAYLCSAWTWRPHGYIIAKKKCGKSTLQQFIKNLLGSAAIDVDGGTSEPGVRRKLSRNALAVLIDEAEADSSHVKMLMGYFRSSSSGATIVKADTKSSSIVTYTVRSMCMLAAVNAPKFKDTDEGRFIRFQLDGAPDKKAMPAILKEDQKRSVHDLGRRLFARMLHSWPRIRKAKEVLSGLLLNDLDSRYTDTLSTILASAWCLLHDEEITEQDAAAIIAEIDLTEMKEKIDESDNDAAIMDCLMDMSIKVKGEDKTVNETCQEAVRGGPYSNSARALRRLGIGVECVDGQHLLLIREDAGEFVALFKSTPYASFDLTTAFKRVPGAHKNRRKEPVYLGGKTKNPLVFPFEYLPEVAGEQG